MKLNYLIPLAISATLFLPLAAQTVDSYSMSGGDLVSVTVNGDAYTVGELVGSSLSAAVDTSGAQLIGNTTALPSPNSAVASDISLLTGVVNIRSVTFTFDAPVENIPGLDILFFDWGAFGSDDFTITINGVTSPLLDPTDTLPSGYDYFTGGGSLNGRIYSNASGYNSVAELDALSMNSGSGSTGASGGLGIDLDNFSVALGATVTEITIFDADSTTDPVLVMGVATIPEPHTYALAFAALVGLLALRRRR